MFQIIIVSSKNIIIMGNDFISLQLTFCLFLDSPAHTG